MWIGDGWKRTRRLLGVTGFVVAFGLEARFHVGLPIGIYGIIGGLLGLDYLAEALASFRVNGRR